MNLLREIVVSGRGGAILAALRERKALERERYTQAQDRKEKNLIRRNMGAITEFIALTGMNEQKGLFAINVPPEVVVLVRAGLLVDIGRAAQQIGEAAASGGLDRVAHRLVGPLEDLDDARVLLVVLGCGSDEPEWPVTVYLDQHRGTLLCAAHSAAEQQESLAEDPDAPLQTRARARENRTLLEQLIAAIGGTLQDGWSTDPAA